MTKLPLIETRREGGLAYLRGRLEPNGDPVAIRYRTHLGAVLRVDGETAGAYDREHHEVIVSASERVRELEFEVELAGLPTNGLPAGPGVMWWFLQRRSHAEPRCVAEVSSCHAELVSSCHAEPVEARPSLSRPSPSSGALRQAQHDTGQAQRDTGQRDNVKLLGHSHLDVAWLWTYEQTRRKAQRTFVIACDLLDLDPTFEYIQSQPQLYHFVEERDPALFERVRAHVAGGRFDPSVAALWVESDCNVPSGESLVRQMLLAHRYCTDRFGIEPSIAWLPDSFGFANTLPQLLAHAGIRYFATTKLQWNDTTKFPYPQFRWRGPDGSEIVSALIQGYDGPAYPWRVANAKKRDEPLLLGYGDGGGGATRAMLERAPAIGSWVRLPQWFDALSVRGESLPVHADELYLEYHRGVYTTHHGVKMHNALCERALREAEELLAWCIAVHAPRATVTPLQARLHEAWRIVLRNQFHDVLPGTSIHDVYRDTTEEYAQAEDLIASVMSAANSILPRARTPIAPRPAKPPVENGDAFLFDNGLIRARVANDGTVRELGVSGGPNLCTQANALALYRDRPRQWEAWNVDRSYSRKMRPATPRGAGIDGDTLLIDFRLGASPAAMRIELRDGDPFLRVTLAVDWQERRTLLRVENWLAVAATGVLYGSPHGTIARTARAQTPQEQAKFEAPGQRFAAAADRDGNGVALLTLDTYGWSARALPKGGLRLGHSLLRGTCWPDPLADRGEHTITYAFMPYGAATRADIERAWLRFGHDPGVALFTSETANALVVACKPAEASHGAIVRVRECDGIAVRARVRSAARMTRIGSVDALERPVAREAAIDAEYALFDLQPFEIRSFLVEFTHES